MIRLKELRHERQLTQKQLAEKLGISYQVVGYYENEINQPAPDMLIQIADFFQCSIDYLLGRSDDLGNVTVYNTTEGYNALTATEQKIVNIIRRFAPPNADEWLTLYSELPSYMQESIFAELKGMHLGYKASKAKKAK